MSDSSETSRSYSGQCALVTGASGFIGKHLVEALLAQGLSVVGFSKHRLTDGRFEGRSFRSVEGDVNDGAALAELFCNVASESASGTIDFVFHLAAQKNAGLAKADPREALSTSFMGTLNILEAARQIRELKRVVLISSLAVYGCQENQSEEPLSESLGLGGNSIYSVTKAVSELLGLGYYSDFGVPVTIARLANVYGPGQSEEAVIGSVLAQMRRSNKVMVGNTSVFRDFVYVKDAVDALLALAQSEKTLGRSINVGSGQRYGVGQVIDALSKVLGYGGEIVSTVDKKRVDEKSVIVPDIRLLKTLTEWSPRYSLEEGLRETASR
jgi:nucleoside-diphosphate-sugar epimerase